ncbi:hypothetical protein BCV69DRAFT_284452 [Microstroma glucosiphilum]|uniref:Peroxin-3 n=1 Tax=Pseudomicrostroma glucosiphilum TaxID=1684307 RepID=A0A316U201_9BASI|nr:hypothetical protein BCV69DRAFT_284452 [Pseudomicrostroma glucosiphilum]PWN19307.1 hypothetical protein BCV69DRAFT_284452 [Pseudomicrostroma glucosiphilum]
MASVTNRNRPVLGSSLLGRASSLFSRVPRPILFTFTFLTSSYLLTTVLLSKLLSIHNRINAESSSKEGLKQRFERNQQDVDFTVLALLPSLKAEMDKVMDVDAITRELKSVGKETQQAAVVPEIKAEPAQQDTEAAAAAAISQPEAKEAAEPDAPQEDAALRAEPPLAFAQSWQAASEGVSKSSEPAPSALDSISEPRPDPIAPHATLNGEHGVGGTVAVHENGQTDARVEANGHAEGMDGDVKGSEGQVNGAVEDKTDATKETEASDSLRTSASTEAQQQEDVQAPSSSSTSLPPQPTEDPKAIVLAESQRQQQLALDRKRKAALWQQLKIVTFTRSLTAIYAISLLSVLTHVQLNLLGRYAYLRDLAGVKQKEAEVGTETMRALASDPFEDAWASANGTQASNSSSQTKETGKSNSNTSTISAETEERYLTFSWYLLHQGWKDLSERVREKVEKVMSSVPLKTQLSHEELTSILRRIRRRIEYDYESEVDDGEAADALASPSSSSAAAPPYTFPGGHTLDASTGSSMSLGAESLMPNGFSVLPEEAKSEAGSSSSMSGSGTLSVTTNGRGSVSGRRRRRRRTRFDLLRAYLLPATPEGDVALLRNAGLLPSDLTSQGRDVGLEERDPTLGALLDETRDIMESSDAQDVSRRCLETCFETQLLDALRTPFGLSPLPPSAASSFPNDLQAPSNSSSSGSGSGNKDPHATSRAGSASTGRFSEILTAQQEAEIRNDPSGTIGRRLKLAAVLPLLASRGTLAFDAMPNEIVETIAANKDLQALSAIIYTSFTGDCL